MLCCPAWWHFSVSTCFGVMQVDLACWWSFGRMWSGKDSVFSDYCIVKHCLKMTHYCCSPISSSHSLCSDDVLYLSFPFWITKQVILLISFVSVWRPLRLMKFISSYSLCFLYVLATVLKGLGRSAKDSKEGNWICVFCNFEKTQYLCPNSESAFEECIMAAWQRLSQFQGSFKCSLEMHPSFLSPWRILQMDPLQSRLSQGSLHASNYRVLFVCLGRFLRERDRECCNTFKCKYWFSNSSIYCYKKKQHFKVV